MEERYEVVTEADADPVALRGALISLYEEWGRADGEAAVEHAFALNRTLVRHAFAGWMAADPQAPRDWVLSQAGSDRRRIGLATALLHAFPVDDHRTRGEWAANFADRASGARLVSEVAIGWGGDEPEAVLGWLAILPVGPVRSGAIEAVFRRWTASDPELASMHLTRMPDGDAKDLAISSLAKAIHRDDPEAARLWVDTITDEHLRDHTNSLLNKLAANAAHRAPPDL